VNLFEHSPEPTEKQLHSSFEAAAAHRPAHSDSYFHTETVQVGAAGFASAHREKIAVVHVPSCCAAQAEVPFHGPIYTRA